jgi:predicted TIM-barrel fold metal-dependent hydrolase
MDDLVLVSVDDHLIEPPNMFDGRLPRALQDRAPQVKRTADGAEVWVFEGEVLVNIALGAVAGRPRHEYSVNPTAFDEMRQGCWDVDARVKDMNANGVLGALCFPSFPQFCGQLFSRVTDHDLALATLRAYNDWHIEDWAGAYPGRFIPLGIVPMWDPEIMAAEVSRLASRGVHAVTFSENPYKLGLPSLHSDEWDPFWGACEDAGTIVCMHIGSSSSTPFTSPDAPYDVSIAISPINLLQTAADLLWSPIFSKFKSLKVALSEGGIGWIPYFLERADWVYERQHTWTGADFGGKSPRDRFHEHIITCFIDDHVGLELRDKVGLDKICWECDYPHSDSTWPTAPETLWQSLQWLPPEDIAQITHRNAMQHFQYDPFRHISPEQATVSSLRSQATGLDLTFNAPRREVASRPTRGDFNRVYFGDSDEVEPAPAAMSSDSTAR